MASRKPLILDLLRYRRPLADVVQDLDHVPSLLDPDHPAGTATRAVLSAMLARVERGEIGFKDLVEWAREVELIEDIDRERGHEEEVIQLLFEMATPEIDDRSERRRLSEWRTRLQ